MARLVSSLLPIVLCATACDSPRMADASGTFTLDRESLDFGRVFVGYRAQTVVEIRSASRASLPLEIQVERPFELVSPVPEELAAGASVRLTVSVSPESTGDVIGTLVVRSGDSHRSVPIRAHVSEPDHCESSECATSAFDPLRAECVPLPLADGTACGRQNRCLVDGRCEEGRCVGLPVRCDDRNACTADACDPAAGCVHRDASAECPGSSNPCEAPRCDPSRGCELVDVVDGTACGPADCMEAQVCMAGTCRTVAVPEGTPCNVRSPCQRPGTCRAGLCDQEPARPLTPAWTRSFTARSSRILVDDHDNLYWSLSHRGTRAIVSETADGRPRYWRSKLNEGLRLLTVHENTLVGLVASNAYGSRPLWINGYDAQTGDELWSLNMYWGLDTCDLADVRAVTAARGQAVFAVSCHEQDPFSADPGLRRGKGVYLLAAVDVRTGAVRWMRTPNLTSVAASSSGLVVAAGAPADAANGPALGAFEANGQTLWELGGLGADVSLRAVLGTSMYVDRYTQSEVEIRSTEDGALRGRIAYEGSNPIVLATRSHVWTSSRNEGSTLIQRYSVATQRLEWARQLPLGGDVQPMLTEQGLLVLTQLEPATLVHIDLLGRVEWTCELPRPSFGRHLGTVTMTGERLYFANEWGELTELSAFDLPGNALAREGWVMPEGSPRLDRRGR